MLHRKLLAWAVAGCLLAPPAWADVTLRVGKAMAPAFNFTPLDVGMATGIFARHGIAIEESSFGGSARLQQALAAGGLDIGLGSGPEFAIVVKGSPVVATGEIAGKPSLLAVVVPGDSALKGKDDLKGRRIAVSTAASLTQWLVRELSRRQGWGPTGIEAPPLGADPTMIAAMRTRQIDGLVTDVATGYRLQADGSGRVLVKFGDVVNHFVIHVVWVQKDLAAKNPKLVKDFMAAWYESVRFMKDNRARTVEITAPVMNVSPDIAAKVYDELMPAMSLDGAFDPQGIDVLASSFPELGLLPAKPDLSKYIDQSFLSAK